MDSGDVEIDPQFCFAVTGVDHVVTSITETGSQDVLQTRTHTADEPRHVVTLPVSAVGYTARLEAFDSAGDLVAIAGQDFNIELGGDARVDSVGCGPLKFNVIFPGQVTPGQATGLSIEVLEVDDNGQEQGADGIFIEIIAAGGNVADPIGFTDNDGLYETTATLAAGNDLLTLFITATYANGTSVTKIITAQSPDDVEASQFIGTWVGTHRSQDLQDTFPQFNNPSPVRIEIIQSGNDLTVRYAVSSIDRAQYELQVQVSGAGFSGGPNQAHPDVTISATLAGDRLTGTVVDAGDYEFAFDVECSDCTPED